MKSLLFCFGTRPEAIKMAPVILEAHRRGLTAITCLTGQHKEMVLPFMDFFSLKEDYSLQSMKHNQGLANLTASILNGMEEVLEATRPDLVCVQGDTTSTFACSLAAFYKKIPVAHIEAGLRTGDIYSPFPEEINRQMTSCYSAYNFAPTEEAKRNLEKEGRSNVFVTGNTSIDALTITIDKLERSQQDINFRNKYPIDFEKPLILITSHRRENHGEPLLNICRALKEIANTENCEIVYPVHLNPNVKEVVEAELKNLKNVHLLDPLSYQEFVWFMKKAFIILTDSGGVQEEGPYFKKPILVLRDNTERPEAAKIGATKLIGTATENILKYVRSCLNNKDFYDSFARAENPYGDGHAAQKILDILKGKN